MDQDHGCEKIKKFVTQMTEAYVFERAQKTFGGQRDGALNAVDAPVLPYFSAQRGLRVITS